MGAIIAGVGILTMAILGVLAWLSLSWCWNEMWSTVLGHEIIGLVLFVVLLFVFIAAFIWVIIGTIVGAVL